MISSHFKQVQDTIAQAKAEAVAPADIIHLVAVSKQQPAEKIDAALATGHRLFGENRVQEAKERWQDRRPHYPDLTLHLIGPLQTNKVSEAVALFDVIETVDREKLAIKLADEFNKQDKHCDCFIQVNTGLEDQKAGISPLDTADFVKYCQQDLALPIKGLMCIPPVDEEAAMHFALLKKLAKECQLPHLSMGMSADYVDAIHFGADYVRVGSALFGERLPRN